MPERRAWLAGFCLCIVAVASLGCGTTYVVEDRDTPVHVWLEAREAAEADVTLDFLIYVGDRKVLEGPVRFRKGQTVVELPPVHMPAGEREVSVVVGGGRTAARATAKVRHATWIFVAVRGGAAEISVHEKEPGSPK